MEEWKSINGFPNYEISSLGNVRSWTKYSKGKLLKPGYVRGKTHRIPYLCIGLSKNNKMYYKYIHRLMLEAFVGPCPDGMEACHNNGNCLDNRLENLRWDTRSENQKDALRHQTQSAAKLYKSDVGFMRSLIPYNGMYVDLSKAYGVHKSSIWRTVKQNRHWKI